MDAGKSQLEQRIGQALSAGDHERALRLTLEGYGPELYGFLLGELRDEVRAEEVFARGAEALWLALPKLTLHSSMRAYGYTVMRHTMFRYLETDLRKERWAIPLSQADASALMAQVRTDTADRFGERAAQRVARLRESLAEDERTLLTLRVDRGLSFREIAEVLCAPDASEATRKAAEARARKRYQLVKDKLRARLQNAT